MFLFYFINEGIILIILAYTRRLKRRCCDHYPSGQNRQKQYEEVRFF